MSNHLIDICDGYRRERAVQKAEKWKTCSIEKLNKNCMKCKKNKTNRQTGV